MDQPIHVRVFYCTNEVRRLMVELPLDGLLQQGEQTLTADEFSHLRAELGAGRLARIDGPDCWFEYELVDPDAERP